MTDPIKGIHHITAFASDPQANVDFYHGILGQRLIKTTVNFDDPGTYHFYFGDYTGSPGSIMTFFPWPNARRGVIGNGQVGVTAYTISPNSIGYWLDRLKRFGVKTEAAQTRFGEEVIPFQDPDGLLLELVAIENQPDYTHWEDGAIPPEHALKGFHSAALYISKPELTSKVMTGLFGYALAGAEGNRLRFQSASDHMGAVLDLLVRPDAVQGRMGAGTVHHIAFRNQDDGEQLLYREKIAGAGHSITPVRDRQYFHSIYFREPNGVLFELATDPPGFTLDEDIPELGTGLRLPPWLEEQRAVIQNILPVFEARVLA